MPFADFHCDTLTLLSEENGLLFGSGHHCDMKFAENFDEFLEVFAIFIPENLTKTEAKIYYLRNITYLYEQLNRFSDKVMLVRSAEDLKVKGKYKVMLSIENFSFATEEEIEKVYSDGVRIASLTWNADNEFAGGAYGAGSLTERGKEIIQAMEKSGVTLDVSHLNERSTDAVLEVAKKPVIATHSSSFELCGDKRNLTDEQYIKIADGGGVVGVNFYRDFIGGDKNAAEIARHVEHYYALCKNGVVWGSDFDGAEMPDGIEGLSSMDVIFREVEKTGISPRELYDNAICFLEKIL